MRILLDYRPALRQRTGVGQYIHETARALVLSAPAGESLVLFSSSWKDRLTADAVPGASVIDRRVPVRALNWLWHRREWPPVERMTGDEFDVTQAAHPLLLPSTRAARIVTVHDLDFLDHPDRTRAEIQRDYPALARSHARRADQVIVVSPHTAREVATRFGVPASHISICPPGGPVWSRREDEPREGGCVLFLGTLEPRKNLSVLLDAYERLIQREPSTPPLVLAGPIGPGSEALVARAQRSPLAGRLELPGYIDPDRKLALFRRALVFVLPSHMEGFGLPAVEAMVAGVPVIAANRGALADTVGQAGRLIDPDDGAALSGALGEILGDASLRRRMSDEGWRHAQQFTWTNTAARTREAWMLAIMHRRERHDD